MCLPRARIVADHFPVVQQVGKALAQVLGRGVRREVRRAALKGHHHLFLPAVEDWEPEEAATRAQLAASFPDLDAAAGLDAWIVGVQREGPAELVQALSALCTWRAEILNFFAFLPTRISNGFVEGKNNRTKALMRQAYGYRNHQHLRLRLLLEVA